MNSKLVRIAPSPVSLCCRADAINFETIYRSVMKCPTPPALVSMDTATWWVLGSTWPRRWGTLAS